MVEVKFFETALDSDLKFAVIAARHQGQWLLCRQKGRTTWEFPGGHREAEETIHAAARRELWEETGATEFQLEPVSAYGIYGPTHLNPEGGVSFGGLFFAEVEELEAIPEAFEIAETRLFDALPAELTYLDIQPQLMTCVENWLNEGNFRPETEDMFEFLL